MIGRDNVTRFAQINIDKYDSNIKKNRVCIVCGFENTKILKDNGHCNICNIKYKLIVNEINNSNNCCIIS